MKEETLHRAQQIQARLGTIAETREHWEDNSYLQSLMFGLARRFDRVRTDQDVPAPIAAFRRACLDALATEEAVLREEFEAL